MFFTIYSQGENDGNRSLKKGRIEWEFQNGSYIYLQEGDMQINGRKHHKVGFGFPLNHYEGITVAIYIEEALKHYRLFSGVFY